MQLERWCRRSGSWQMAGECFGESKRLEFIRFGYIISINISAPLDATPQCKHELKLESGGRVSLLFPITVCHVIDAESPLYDLSAQNLRSNR